MRRLAFTCALCTVAILFSALLVADLAAKPQPPGPGEPRIEAVQADYANSQLIILGDNLHFGVDPVVMFSGAVVPGPFVLGAGGTELRTSLPAVIAGPTPTEASYLLTIENSGGFASAMVTIGALGANRACQADEAIQAINPDGTVVCEPDSDSGTITGVTAGTGLAGGGSSGNVTLSVDTGEIQQRVTGSCAAGSSIRVVNSNGTVLCQADNDSGGDITGVAAGFGLTGGGTAGDVALAADPGVVQQRVTGTCPAGSAIRGVNQDGSVSCEADDNSGGTVTSITTGAGLTGGTITTSGTVAADFAGPGSASTVARSDHTHEVAGVENVAVGPGALPNTTGSGNAATGFYALGSNTTGSYNTAIGVSALRANTIGQDNTATGNGALRSNTLGGSNTATGTSALFYNNVGTGNTATGRDALFSNTTGNANTATGLRALAGNTTGTSNTATGLQALYFNSTGNYNTAYGASALEKNTTGGANTASGTNALYSNTTGASNTATGFDALRVNTTGGENTATGVNTLFSNTIGSFNTATGVSALRSNTDGAGNTATGHSAMRDNTTGGGNTATGVDALKFNTTGSNNTAMGVNALGASTGSSNTAVGVQALQNGSGNTNVAVGLEAQRDNTVGFSNVAVGVGALTFNGQSSRNVAIGSAALLRYDEAAEFGGHTVIGHDAMESLRTGSSNVAIGLFAGANLTNGSDNIYISNLGAAIESGTIRIGTSSQTKTFVTGIHGVNVDADGDVRPVYISNDSQLGTAFDSSREVKEDIRDMAGVTDGLYRLRPVTFRYRRASEGQPLRALRYGLIAEEVAEVYPELVTRAADGRVTTVRYDLLAPMLLNELQKQQRESGRQAQELRNLEARHAELATDHQALRAAFEQLAQQTRTLAELARRLEHLQALAAPVAALSGPSKP